MRRGHCSSLRLVVNRHAGHNHVQSSRINVRRRCGQHPDLADGLARGLEDRRRGSGTLSVGSELFSNETVRTGEASQAQLLFLDQTNLSVGARSEVKLDRFVYNPDRKTGNVVIEASRGAFRFVSGSQNPRSYTIKTPFATIGVRGTIFSTQIGKTGEHIYVTQ